MLHYTTMEDQTNDRSNIIVHKKCIFYLCTPWECQDKMTFLDNLFRQSVPKKRDDNIANYIVYNCVYMNSICINLYIPISVYAFHSVFLATIYSNRSYSSYCISSLGAGNIHLHYLVLLPCIFLLILFMHFIIF